MITKLLFLAIGSVFGTTAGLMLGSWLARGKDFDEIRNYHFKLKEQKGRDGVEVDRSIKRFLRDD